MTVTVTVAAIKKQPHFVSCLKRPYCALGHFGPEIANGCVCSLLDALKAPHNVWGMRKSTDVMVADMSRIPTVLVTHFGT